MTVSKILIAVDRTAAAFKAVKVGFSLAKSLKKTEVLLIHVIDPAWAIGDIDSGILPEQVLAKLHEETDHFLTQLIQIYGADLEPLSIILEGKVTREIIQTAKNYQADILVLGVHDRQGISQLFIEDVVKEIMPHAPCPILLAYEEN